MSLPDSETTSSLKECPRCLGKGHVDWNDIKRLKQVFHWMPGSCAYCHGNGKVDQNIEDKVPVDASYLVVDLSENERKRITHGDQDAIERAKQFEKRNRFINVLFLGAIAVIAFGALIRVFSALNAPNWAGFSLIIVGLITMIVAITISKTLKKP